MWKLVLSSWITGFPPSESEACCLKRLFLVLSPVKPYHPSMNRVCLAGRQCCWQYSHWGGHGLNKQWSNREEGKTRVCEGIKEINLDFGQLGSQHGCQFFSFFFYYSSFIEEWWYSCELQLVQTQIIILLSWFFLFFFFHCSRYIM